MARTDYPSIDAYIYAQPPATQAPLRELRRILGDALPGTTEGISYQIPVLKKDGKFALYFAGYAKHVGVYPVTAAVADELADAIAPYRNGKATLRFPLDGIPEALLREICAVRTREMAAAPAKKPRTPKGAPRA